MTTRISLVCLLLTATACFDPKANQGVTGSTSDDTACGVDCPAASDTTSPMMSTGDTDTKVNPNTAAGSGETTPVGGEDIGSHDGDAEGVGTTTPGDVEETGSTAQIGSTAEVDDTAESGSTAVDEDAETGIDRTNDLRVGLVLLMAMDEEAWGGVSREVRDASGQENHGVAIGGATTTAQGRFGRAGTFDGTSWIEVADEATLRPSSQLTISAWVRPTSLGSSDSYGIIAKREGFADQTSYALFLSTEGHLTCDLQLEDDRFAAETAIAVDRWTHVAVVYDGDLPESERVRMFIDGELERVAPETSTTIDPTFGAQLRIGDLPNGGQPFIGQIDEVAIWSRALEDEEIALLRGLERSLAPET